MAFVISKAPESEFEKPILHGDEASASGRDNGVVSSQLLLKSAGNFDRDVVLRRIRHYKRLNKVKKTFEALVAGGSESAERRMLQHFDVFSSP